MAEILDVDLEAFEHGDSRQARAVVDGVRRSLETGFVYTSHDIPTELLDEAYDLVRQFFALPADDKQRWAFPERSGQTGYTGPLVETAAGADVPDWKEMYNWGVGAPVGHPLRRYDPARYADHVLPDEPPGLAKILTDLHEHLANLQARILRIVALGLGCAPAYFDDLLATGAHLSRAIHYPPMTAAPGQDHVWAGGHKDINLITALPRATERGLQLLQGDQWVDVAPPAGHVIINTGIMLERLTNGIIPAGIHRVVSDPGFSGDRYSIVQFCHPASWWQIGPLPSCVDQAHPLRYGTIEAGKLLEDVLYQINMAAS
jgi:isopenicillin N synthase-like dioxygenase